MPLRQAARAFSILMALCVLTGCTGSLAGDWKMTTAKPNRETIAIDNVQLARDGSYSATFTLDGRTSAEKGVFEFNGFKLTFRPSAGGSRTYNAVRKMNDLELRDGDKLVILRKQ
jgi:hypothetical protein